MGALLIVEDEITVRDAVPFRCLIAPFDAARREGRIGGRRAKLTASKSQCP